MAQIIQPWHVLLAALAGWINRHQQTAIDYLREENRVLLEQLAERRVRFTDDQRRRLAVAGKAVGRKALLDLASNILKRNGIDPAPERGCRGHLGAAFSALTGRRSQPSTSRPLKYGAATGW